MSSLEAFGFRFLVERATGLEPATACLGSNENGAVLVA